MNTYNIWIHVNGYQYQVDVRTVSLGEAHIGDDGMFYIDVEPIFTFLFYSEDGNLLYDISRDMLSEAKTISSNLYWTEYIPVEE